MTISVLIAGADAGRRAKLASPLISQGYYIIEAESGARSFELLKRRPNIAAALIDVEMADIGNVDLIANIRAGGLKMPIIAMAGSEEDERLRRAVAAGADDFLIYPISPERLSISVGNMLQRQILRQNLRRPKRLDDAPAAVSKWVSNSPAMQDALAKAAACAKTGGILLICGEQGTGRKAVARAIHEESRLRAPRAAAASSALSVADEAEEANFAPQAEADYAAAPFVFVACGDAAGEGGGLPDGAALDKAAAQAAGGTLCFGAVDILGKTGQAHLLHFIERQLEAGHILQKRQKEPQDDAAGERQTRQAFRLMVLAAAHLEDLVAEGSFSIGLYKRLGTQILQIPPLRSRREDIPEMADYILARLISETEHTKLNGISGAAQTLLSHYDWPGNFPELEAALFRAVLLSEGRLLGIRDFPQLAEPAEERGALQPLSGQQALFYDLSGHIKPLAEIEKEAIVEAMKRYRSKISEVARRLKIGRSTLYRKLEEYGLHPDKD